MVEFKPEGKAAVLLNGKKVDYFVGNVDEFNHDWWLAPELIVPPGTHKVTVTREGKELYNGHVTVGRKRKGRHSRHQEWRSDQDTWTTRRGIAKKATVAAFYRRHRVRASGRCAAQNQFDGDRPRRTSIADRLRTSGWHTTDVVDTTIGQRRKVDLRMAARPSHRTQRRPNVTATGPGGTVTSTMRST